ncbi:MAG: hypothetical protein IT214_12990 [Chitinophagaceae bacterium]|jgi:membrane protein YqaA with SNARE-associated domain|nr:hypothetical protein [Chitinophagaceae bacterium]OQY93209.1 MAG: hypothetical protein B6D37_12155 [Sphingobacteriales bacterium UTBCD1]
MNILIYGLVFLGSLLVDIVPLIGPPAWTVMVFFQVRYQLDIWIVLIVGVIGSTIGRYFYSLYVPVFSKRFIKKEKNEDLHFIGKKLSSKSWKIHLFVFLYTLIPMPSTPLFTAAGVARIKAIYIIPAFFAGKFISDAVMVITGDYVVTNIENIGHSFLSWKTVLGTTLGVLLICFFLFVDWRKLLIEKKFRIHFNIWKKNLPPV